MYGRGVRIILVAFVAASLCSACGGSGGSSNGAVTKPGAAPPAAAAKDRDSCTLVTKQEVAAMLGQAVTDTSKTDNGICTYHTAGDPQIGVLVLDNFATRDTFDSYIESGKEHAKTYPMSGIGDEAVYVDASLEGFRTLSLHVLKNKLHFALVGLENVKGQEGKTQPLPSVRTLAMQAVSQLG
jgi:hypothetical protein